MKKIAIVLTAVTLALSLAACGGTTDPKQAKYEDCVKVAQESGHKPSEYVPVCELASGYSPK